MDFKRSENSAISQRDRLQICLTTFFSLEGSRSYRKSYIRPHTAPRSGVARTKFPRKRSEKGKLESGKIGLSERLVKLKTSQLTFK